MKKIITINNKTLSKAGKGWFISNNKDGFYPYHWSLYFKDAVKELLR